MKTRVLKVLDALINAVLIAVLIVNLYNIVQRNVFGRTLPKIFGVGYAIVVSGSMNPEISVDDVVCIMASDTYEVGDIITFSDDDPSFESLVTHRIVEVTDDGFITKGDANNTVDLGVVRLENIEGKVISVFRGAGVTLSWLRKPVGSLVMILLALLFLELPYQIRSRKKVASDSEIEEAVSALRPIKHKKTRTAADALAESPSEALPKDKKKIKVKPKKPKRRKKPDIYVPEEGQWNID